MTDVPSHHARYPFFEDARTSVESFNRVDMSDQAVLDRAIDRIVATVDTPDDPHLGGPHTADADDLSANAIELLSYPLARILVSSVDDDTLTETYARVETDAALQRIYDDDEFSIIEGCEEFGISARKLDNESLFHETAIFEAWDDLTVAERQRRMDAVINIHPRGTPVSESEVEVSLPEYINGSSINRLLSSQATFYAIPVPIYLSYAPVGDDDSWTLVNRSVSNGEVVVRESELDTLLQSAIHDRLTENLPVPVPRSLRDRYEESVETLLDRINECDSQSTDVPNLSAFSLFNDIDLPRQYPLGIDDTEQYAGLGETETDIDITKIRDHYHKAKDVYEAIGRLDEFHTSWLGAAGHAGWYVSDSLEDESENVEAWQAGFREYSRPSILPDDFDASEAGRSVYTTNTYAPRDAFTTRYYTYEDGERVWMDAVRAEENDDVEEKTRLPDYDELGAYSLIVDIDLEDEYKSRPLPDDYQAIVEQRLDAWIGVFANIIGGNREDIFAVDSGGGAYVLTPPAATRPIAEEFEGDDLHAINNAIQTRMRTLTDTLDELITGLDNAPTDLFSADAVQNKNRQWKSILSVHTSLDAVVHPIDPMDIDYDAVSLGEVTDGHYDDAREWANRFTETSYESYVDKLVEAIFTSNIFDETPYETYDGDDWTEVLENFIEARDRDEAARQEAFERFETSGEVGDVGVTTDKYEIDAALANVDLEKYLKGKHVQQWDTDNRTDGTVSFAPRTWRNPSKDANSCFYSPGGGATMEPVFVDRKEGWTAGIISLIAYDAGITSHPSETPRGRDWWKAVDKLRENGEDIPLHVPDIEDSSNDYDQLPESSLVKVARTLGFADEDDIEVVDGEYGEYERIENGAVFKETIDYLEEEGIKTGKSDTGST